MSCPGLPSEQRSGSTPLPILVGAVALAVCCGAPLLVGALLATGVGAIRAAASLSALGIGVAAAGAVAVWRMARTWRTCDPVGDKGEASKGIR